MTAAAAATSHSLPLELLPPRLNCVAWRTFQPLFTEPNHFCRRRLVAQVWCVIGVVLSVKYGARAGSGDCSGHESPRNKTPTHARTQLQIYGHAIRTQYERAEAARAHMCTRTRVHEHALAPQLPSAVPNLAGSFR